MSQKLILVEKPGILNLKPGIIGNSGQKSRLWGIYFTITAH